MKEEKKMRRATIILLLVGLLFFTCKSTEKTTAPETTTATQGEEQVVLTAPNPNDPLYTSSMAFSPNGDGKQDTIQVIPNLKDTKGIVSYELRILDSKGTVVKQMSGKLAELKTYSWNGLDDNKKPLPEGTYKAELTLTSESGEKKVISSNYFNLDNTPPVITLSLAPLPFSPDGDGTSDTLTISMTVKDISPADSWTVKIRDANKKLFFTLKGTDPVPAEKTWNGYDAKGTQVKSASVYTTELTVVDKAGNASSVTQELPVDVLVFKMGSKQKLLMRSITFAPYKTTFSRIKADEVASSVRWLANILKQNPTYTLIIEGHALNIYERDPAKHQKEEEILLPLSKKRAETIKALLVAEGISADRITTQGLGSSEPIVAPSDAANQWKNRRVDFLIVK
jgi:outer membrane protein OmpA-like peptidoglycan-associated protein